MAAIFYVLLGVLLGGAVTWVIVDALGRAKHAKAIQEVAAGKAASDARSEDALKEVARLRTELEEFRRECEVLRDEKTRAVTSLSGARQELEERAALLEDAQARLTDTFKSLATTVLEGSQESFLKLAETRFKSLQGEAHVDLEARRKSIESLIKPIEDTLKVYAAEVKAVEEIRITDKSALKEQIENLARGQQDLHTQTARLVSALKTPHVRGRWGEIALRNTAELAGMSSYCDFVEQESVEGADGRLRPDMLVRLPAGRQIIVDSKVAVDAYIRSLDADTEAERDALLARHAIHLKTHIDQLSSKAYWSQFPETPEFVVLFIPNDSFLAAATDKDNNLINYAIERKVIVATPSTFIALLKAISFGWRQEKLADNARIIAELGKEMSNRMGTLATHLASIGTGLTRAVGSYNDAVGSFERSVLPQARKFKDLGAEGRKEIPELQELDISTRIVRTISEDVESVRVKPDDITLLPEPAPILLDQGK
jgi:DNA recombination protein RmuC